MTKQKANISLSAAADSKNSGLGLTVRKGVNELLSMRLKRNKKEPLPDAGDQELSLSLIICTAGESPGLTSAVESALNQTADKEDYEVIVVWNKSGKIENAGICDRVRTVQEQRKGLSFARNRGAECANGRLLLYMDDDAAADRNLVRIMTETFAERENTAIIGGQIRLAVPKPKPEVFLPGREGLWSAYTVPYKDYREVREQYAFPYGACFAVRRSVLEELGGFPSDYGRVGNDFAGGEETALCFLAQKRGWKIGIQPAAWVEHRVDPKRFSRRHVKETIRAGIFTTYRLTKEGYADYVWDLRYIRERIRISELELAKFEKCGRKLEYYYKKCERDAFAELLKELEKNA